MKSKSPKLAMMALSTVLVLGGAACSSSSSSGDAAADRTTTTSAIAPSSTAPTVEPITIVVTDDDGIEAPGIDELVKQLTALPKVTVKVVAPAENQSGKGDSTTEGKVEYHPGKTASGFEGIAVVGTPADSVDVALDELGLKPDLIASGINQGQNAGPLVTLSGTVGATLNGARKGVPGVAGSAGLKNPDYELGAKYVAEWVEANRAKIAAGDLSTDHIVNFNVPTCTKGTAHDLVVVPTSPDKSLPDGVNPFEADCAATPATYKPTDDIDALAHGFSARSLVPTTKSAAEPADTTVAK